MRNAGLLDADKENPLAEVLMSWRITVAFAAGALAGAALEICAFSSTNSLAAFGWTWGDYACKVPFIYVKTLVAMCSPAGIVAIILVAVTPVLLEFGLIGRAVDDDRHLVYIHGVLFLLFGLVALSQFSGAKVLWFWRWGGGAGCVPDGVLKCLSMCLCAIAAIWSLTVFTIELFLRNFRRIETRLFQDEAEAEGAAEVFASVKRVQRIVRTCLLVEPLLVFACVVPFRAQRLERAMLDVVADAMRETAEECRGADYIFTDGGLDAAVAEMDKRYRDQRFLADRAIKLEDWETARRELSVLIEMIPDRNDDRHRQAASSILEVERKVKGGK